MKTQTQKSKPNDLDRHIGKRIRQLRAEREVPQEQLASDLGITSQQIQKYEKGANRISASNLYYLANALNIPLRYFYTGFEKS